jgi:hypothetical protein
MAQPIFDEQLSKLAMNQSWRDTPMKLNLGSLLVATKVVHIDKALYNEISPNGNATDMDEIEAIWKKNKTGEKRVSMVSEDEGKKKAEVDINICEYGKMELTFMAPAATKTKRNKKKIESVVQLMKGRMQA